MLINKKKYPPLFDITKDQEILEPWRKEWQGMPEFENEDNRPFQKIILNFKTKADVDAFFQLIGKKPSYECDNLWFPIKGNIRNTEEYRDETALKKE